MTELEKILEQIKEYLEETTGDDLSVKLNRIGREIGRKQSGYSVNSAEYQELGEKRALVERAQKLLRDKEKEESGLVPARQTEPDEMPADENLKQQEQNRIFPEELRGKELLAWLNERNLAYTNAKKKNDVKTMQRLYREVAAEAQKGKGYAMNLIAKWESDEKNNKERVLSLFQSASDAGYANAAYNVAREYRKGYLTNTDPDKAKEHLEYAAQHGCKQAMYERGLALLGQEDRYLYQRDEEAAYQQFKAYIRERTPLDMKNDIDRCVLFLCFYHGSKTGHDMTKEDITESWRSLLEVEGAYTESAKCLHGLVLASQGRYEEAVQALADVGTEQAMEELEEIFFSDYFEKKPLLKQKLENFLMQLRDSDETNYEVREELYEWYGWRYETGKDMIKDTACAYAYYAKAASLGGWEKYDTYRNRILKKLKKEEVIVFYKNVLEQGCFDVAGELGRLYEEKRIYDEAKAYYQQGAEYAVDTEIKFQCREGYARCNKAYNKRQTEIEEATPGFNMCNTSAIGTKEIGFRQLKELADKGNAYAALRYAQVAEHDTYLREVMKDFPTDAQIHQYYKKAADAGEVEAISRVKALQNKR